MQIRRAKRRDLEGINALLNGYAFHTLDRSYINHRDISIVAEDNKRIVGFLWVGLMRQNKQGYIDHFVVDPVYTHKKVGKQLAVEALAVSLKLGVEEVFGIIAKGKHFDKSGFNALRMAIGSDGHEYVRVRAQLKHVVSELRSTL